MSEAAELGYAGDLVPQQAWEMLTTQPSAALVDVRTRAEWTWVGVPDLAELNREVITIEWNTWPGGQPNEDFLTQLAAAGVDPGQPVLFLCRSGARSISAAKAATAAGYGQAYNIAEGFEGSLDAEAHRGVGGWRANGLPWKQS